MSNITRTVYYYKIFNPDGSLSFNRKIQKICELPEVDREYTHQDVTVNIQVAASGTGNDLVLSGVVRLLRYVAPSVGLRGTNSSKPIELEDDEGVNEKTHFVYIPSKNVIAVEYNHYGPKVGLLFKVVNELYRSNFDSKSVNNSYIYITNSDGLTKISNSHGIRKVHLEYVEEPLDTAQDTTPLMAAYRNALSVGDTQSVEMILKPRQNSRDRIMSGVEFIKNLIPHGGSSSSDLSGFKKLKVTYENETGGTDVLDLIQDKLSRDFSAIQVKEGTKEINSDYLLSSMYDDLADRNFKL